MRGGIADGRCISSAAAVTAELRPSALPQTASAPPRPPASPPRTPSGPPRRGGVAAAPPSDNNGPQQGADAGDSEERYITREDAGHQS
jgi:hypothetical protein